MFAIIYNVETILNPILQMRKLKCRVAKSPASVNGGAKVQKPSIALSSPNQCALTTVNGEPKALV